MDEFNGKLIASDILITGLIARVEAARALLPALLFERLQF